MSRSARKMFPDEKTNVEKKVHIESYDFPGPRSSAKLYSTNISLLKNNKKILQSFVFIKKVLRNSNSIIPDKT